MRIIRSGLVVGMLGAAFAAFGALAQGDAPAAAPATIRVAVFELDDVRTDELADPRNPRLRRLAEVIQRVRPNVILLSGIAYDLPGGPGVTSLADTGQNARRFVERFLSAPQAAGLRPLRYRAFMAATNSGMPSGFDLDRSGAIETTFPPPRPAGVEPGERSLRFAGDAWGFGLFPGHRGMAVLVDERLELLEGEVRTFRLMPWDYVAGAHLPVDPATRTPWFTAEELQYVRLSSSSHWDVPVRLPNGAVVHFLCSSPAPPLTDGPEQRHARRNHDEIRFWADYIDDADYIVDDENTAGGLRRGTPFVLLGSLNADPSGQGSYKDPIGTVLFTSRHLNPGVVPLAATEPPPPDPEATSRSGRRLDYVLPSRGLDVVGSGVWRDAPGGAEFPSEHFPVWMDVRVAGPAR